MDKDLNPLSMPKAPENLETDENRDPITKDDVLNLKISLETSDSVEQFLKSLE